MIRVRRSDERGRMRLDWLEARYSFSFADYFAPDHMGFGPLRVLNQDRIAPGTGFGEHGHADAEIVTYVLSGELEHRDGLGHVSRLRPGDVQAMSAGRGIRHSEYNASTETPLELLQIWLLPAERGTDPGYAERHFSASERRGRLRPIATPDGADDSLVIGQDARVYASLLEAGERVALELAQGRRAWVQVARGAIRLGDEELAAGDGAAVELLDTLELEAREASELLVFDLP